MTHLKQLLQRSAVWGTPLRSKTFTSAVWRLTFLYTATVGFLLAFFSIIVFQVFTQTIGKTSLGLISAEFRDDNLQHEIAEHLYMIILYTDIGCFIITFFLSYWLARKTLRPLEISYLTQKQFIADTAHELRTPLAVMKAGGEVLLQHERSVAEYQMNAASVLEETNRLIVLTNGLLSLARPSAAITPKSARFSLSNLVSDTCKQVTGYAAQHRVALQVAVTPGVDIQGRSGEVGQAILNIIKNAVDYNHPEGMVTVTVKAVGAEAVLTIEDTGIGIAKEKLPFIFERFYKIDTARTGKEGVGAGLGLAIVKEIVTSHHGTITVTSVPAVGTTITVKFPCLH